MLPHLLGLRAALAVSAHVNGHRGRWFQIIGLRGRWLHTIPAQGFGLLSASCKAILPRLGEACSFVPIAARRALEFYAKDLEAVAPQLRFRTQLIMRASLEMHLWSHRVLDGDCNRHPEILTEPLQPPVFIVGLPRTGTTLLHHLMALDPKSQCLRAYEMMRPVRSVDGTLPVHIADFLDWARLALFVTIVSRLFPQWLHHHDLDANSPEECLFAVQRCLPLDTHYRLRSVLMPTYSECREIPDDAYDSYRVFLKQVQRRRGTRGKHYALKGQLLHLQYLEQLCRSFPDAKLVWTHRPPVDVVGSLCSLRRSQHEIFRYDDVDPGEVGPSVLEYLVGAFEKAKVALDTPGVVDGNSLVHVQYGAMVEDPIRVVELIYAHWGWSVSAEHRAAMEEYLSDSRTIRSKRSHDRAKYHRPRLEDYGLSVADVVQVFAPGRLGDLATMERRLSDSSGVLTHSQLTAASL